MGGIPSQGLPLSIKSRPPRLWGLSCGFSKAEQGPSIVERWLADTGESWKVFFGDKMVCECMQCLIFFGKMRPCPACISTDSRQGHLKTCPLPQYGLRNRNTASRTLYWATYLEETVAKAAPLAERTKRRQSWMEAKLLAAEERAAKEDFNGPPIAASAAGVGAENGRKMVKQNASPIQFQQVQLKFRHMATYPDIRSLVTTPW